MRKIFATLWLLGSAPAMAQTMPPSPVAATNAASPPVTAAGIVPDESTKAAILARLRAVYGTDRVVDRIEVGGVVTPANWSHYVTAMIGPDLKQVSKGQIKVNGNAIDITGDVPNEATRQQVLSELSSTFDAHYGIKQNLRVVPSQQKVLDDTLANRTVQFQSGSAVLTPEGRTVVEQMATAMKKLDSPAVAIVGNTDNVGNRSANIALSLARANTVKDYLVSLGLPAANLSVSGLGPDDPIADNTTDAGRARNRRIDFRINRR